MILGITILDSPSKAVLDQRLDGDIGREELIEEAFYLLGDIAGEELAQDNEAVGEERDSLSPVRFIRDRTDFMGGRAGFGGERRGDGHNDEQGFEFSRLGDVGCFEIEAAGFEVAEQGFNFPARTIAGERGPGPAVRGERQQLAGLSRMITIRTRSAEPWPPEPRRRTP